MTSDACKVACFITPHGYGHAARASAVMTAIHERAPDVQFEIFTAVPPFLFRETLGGDFKCHHVMTDVGLFQKTPLEEDLDRTVEHLDAFLPFDAGLVKGLAETVTASRCRLVLCDIAPLGIAVAREAGVPSVLMENFTWDWIYEGYLEECREIQRHIDYLKSFFTRADYHIQTAPVCDPGSADLTTGPVAREPRMLKEEIRGALKIPKDARAVLISMGGVPARYEMPKQGNAPSDLFFIMPGTTETIRREDNFIMLPHQSGFYHPDLIRASDAVVTKTGYSTLAETYHTGLPIGYLSRDGFRESPILERFIQDSMAGLRLSEKSFENGSWIESVDELLAISSPSDVSPNGAGQVARFVMDLLR